MGKNQALQVSELQISGISAIESKLTARTRLKRRCDEKFLTELIQSQLTKVSRQQSDRRGGLEDSRAEKAEKKSS